MVQQKSDVTIRRLVEADLPKVNDIDRSLSGRNRTPTWSFSFEIYWRMIQPDLGFVAEIGGDVVGFIAGQIRAEKHRSLFTQTFFEGLPTRHERVGWVDMIGVSPSAQGKGAGRALVESFYQECKRNNVPMVAFVRDSDDRLRDFVVAMGFKKGEVTAYQRDP